VLSLPVSTADITKPTSVVVRGSQEKKEGDRLKVRNKTEGRSTKKNRRINEV
jgi:hypothetical protein